jgi:hypothetical protein
VCLFVGVCICGFCIVCVCVCVCLNAWILYCVGLCWVFVLCGCVYGCFGNKFICIYCVLYCLYCVFLIYGLGIHFLICYFCTCVRTIFTE